MSTTKVELDLPKKDDPACHRELQSVVDVTLKDGTFKDLDFKRIEQLGHELLMKGDIYEVVRKECREDFFYFIDTVLAKISGIDSETGIGKFQYSRAKHFRWMKYLIDAQYPATGVELNEIYRFGADKENAKIRPFHIAPENKWHNKKLMLLPRNHGKSRVFNIAYCMWRLLRNPNMRILMLSEIRDNAIEPLTMIKDLYVLIRDSKNTENFIAYYVMGDWIGPTWNEDAIRVKTRTAPDPVPSIVTAGMETEVTSKHFDLIICDDVVGEKNVTTPEQIEKHKGRISRLTEVGDYDRSRVTDYIFLGTRWHYSDYYSVILDELTDIYDILKLGCWDDDTHEPLFPEKYTAEMLENLKREKLTSPHPEEWSNQWLNEPQDSKTALFKRDEMSFYDNVDKVLEGSFVGVFVDTSWTENKWSDYIAMVPVAIGNFNTRYVLPYRYFKEDNPFTVAQELIKICAPYYDAKRLRVVAVEDGPTYRALYPIIADRAPWMPLTQLKINNREKDSRIMALASLTTYNKLFLRKDMHDLIEQLIRFPRYTRRDLADALAYHLDLYPISTQGPTNPPAKHLTNTESFKQRLKMDDAKAERQLRR